MLPFIIVAPVEHLWKTQNENVIDVRTEQVFNYTPEQVYDAIKSVDTLDAEKPFLMYLDLPIPIKCVLEKEEVGGLRTCYFNSGKFSSHDFGAGIITERITQMERGDFQEAISAVQPLTEIKEYEGQTHVWPLTDIQSEGTRKLLEDIDRSLREMATR